MNSKMKAALHDELDKLIKLAELQDLPSGDLDLVIRTMKVDGDEPVSETYEEVSSEITEDAQGNTSIEERRYRIQVWRDDVQKVDVTTIIEETI